VPVCVTLAKVSQSHNWPIINTVRMSDKAASPRSGDVVDKGPCGALNEEQKQTADIALW